MVFDDDEDRVTVPLNARRAVVVLAEWQSCGFAAAALNLHPRSLHSLLIIGPSGARDFGEGPFQPLIRATLGTAAQIPVLGRASHRAVFHRRSTFQDFWEQEGFENPADVRLGILDAIRWSATLPNADRSALPLQSGRLRYDIAPHPRALSLPATML